MKPSPVALSVRILDAQVRSLYENLPQGLVITFIVFTMVGVLSWGIVPKYLLVPWLCTASIVVVLRAALLVLFAYCKPPAEEMRRWHRFFVAGVIAAGLLWSVVGTCFLQADKPLFNAALMLIMAAMVSGSVPQLGASKAALITYTILTILPVSAVLALKPEPEYRALASLMVAYFMAMFLTAFRFHRSLTHTLMVRFTNEDLSRQSLAEKQAIESLNEDLRKEVTERRAAQEALSAAKDAAEAANVAKSRFLANMSHELRTPMNGVIGVAQLLLDPKLDPAKRVQYAQTIVDSGRNLINILNDILDLSKIEAGKLTIENTHFVPEVLVNKVTELFKESAQQKGLRLNAEITADLNISAYGDALRIRQMLSNLVGNAIKFTSKGEVRIGARWLGDRLPGQSTLLRFEVSDTGIGIDKQTQAQLFQPFIQGDDSSTRTFGGTGLGLAIVKELSSLLGGDVGLESIPGSGSSFWFTVAVRPIAENADLPQFAKTREIPLAELAQTNASYRILIVEDDPTNRLVVEAMLEKLGFSHGSATNGREAIDALNETHYDLILMDQHMPVMDGLEATRTIRASEQVADGKRLPIVALTASAFEEDKTRALAAGMDDFLTKPLEFKELRNTLYQWLDSA